MDIYGHRVGFFSEHAQRALQFLVARGFAFTSASEPAQVRKTLLDEVTFQSPRVWITIIHCLRDGEIYISFGRIDKEEHFSFCLFLKLVNPELSIALEKVAGPFMPETPEEVAFTIVAFAKAMEVAGHRIITGDDSLFEAMKQVRWWDFCPSALDRSGGNA